MSVAQDFMNGGPPRRIAFVTATRADFGKIEPLSMIAREMGFAIEFFVTGMHMSHRYGLTKMEVARRAHGAMFEFINQRDGDAQETVMAKTITGLADYLSQNRPDLVIVHGDRVEALAASMVCAMQYVRCAHVEGGELSGSIDELFRHCATKLASYHFVSSEAAKRRIERLGEPGNTICVLGSPELDRHARPSGVSLAQVRTRYDIADGEYGIVVFHPVTSERGTMERSKPAT